MERFLGHCEEISNGLDIEPLRQWIVAIPFSEWPQQHSLYGEARPAMVNQLDWNGFGERAKSFVGNFGWLSGLRWYNPMLSALMPGHFIASHTDEQGGNWLFRVHVPILTNPSSCFFMDWAYHLQPGSAYKVNVERKHALINHGNTPRIHFMFDVGF